MLNYCKQTYHRSMGVVHFNLCLQANAEPSFVSLVNENVAQLVPWNGSGPITISILTVLHVFFLFFFLSVYY